MKDLELSARDKSELVAKIKRYFTNEMHQDIGQFEAEFLLDFFSKNIGTFYYNQGVQDAAALLSKQHDEIQQLMYEMEAVAE